MLALKNKTVLITRPKEQSEDFFYKLEQLGAHPIEFPLIKLVPTNPTELLNIYNIKKFDWIIFTSYNAVHTFFKVINPKTIVAKIAVVGSKTDAELKKYQLNAAFIPSVFTAEILANEIPISENDAILIPQSVIAKSKLVEILKNRKALVEPLNSYQNIKVEYSKADLEKIFSKKIDFITFTSGSTIEAFADLKINLKHTKVVCIGPETAKVANANNIKVDAVANPYNIEGIINAIIDFN